MKNWIIGALATALAVSVAAGVIAQPGGRSATVEIRVWEDVNDPERNYISVRPEGGSWRTLGTIPIPLTDGVSSSGRFRYGDIALAVPLPDAPAAPSAAATGGTAADCRTSEGVWSRYDSGRTAARDRDDVADGRNDDVYTGRYTGARLTQSEVNVDHIVARSYACRNGGYAWSDAKVRRFVNDATNLATVSAVENRKKSDSGPSRYLPSRWVCSFVDTFDRIVREYGIQVPAADQSKVNDTQARCASGVLTDGDLASRATPTATPTRQPRTSTGFHCHCRRVINAGTRCDQRYTADGGPGYCHNGPSHDSFNTWPPRH